MFIAGNFIVAIAQIISMILTFFMWAIIIKSLISWVNPDPYNPIVQILNRITEPILSRLRRLIPMYNMGIDLSPLIAILLIIFVKIFVVTSLFQLADKMH